MTPFLERVHDLARRAPEHPAVVYRGEITTRARLWSEITKRETQLRNAGLEAGQRVGLLLRRSPDFVAAALACWRAGASWFPLAIPGPSQRNDQWCRLAAPSLIVSHDRIERTARTASFEQDDEAYVIFTSGSTGVAKGVRVGHGGLFPMLREQNNRFAISEGSRVYWGLSPLFDASISDWGTALSSGATLCIRDHLETFERGLLAMCPTHVDVPPALLPLLPPDGYPSIETVIVGGEVTEPEAIRRWARTRRVLNVYGPTEATVCVSAATCRTDWSEPDIGKPFPGVEFLVGRETGSTGELWIGGPQVALGYLDAPRVLNDRFVTRGGVRFFKTGDRVRKSRDGFVFIGRQDRQFKVRGRLVAPEEVEAALGSVAGVREAFVMKGRFGKIVAYVSCDVSEKEIRMAMTARVPEWMCPATFRFLDRLPRTESGKVDASRLPIDAPPRFCADPLADVLARVAGHSIRTDLSFSQNGLDSLDAIKASMELSRRGVAVSPEVLLSATTLTTAAVSEQSGGMSAAQIKQDITRLPVVRDRSVGVAEPRGDGILLTGATGGLGRMLLKQLAKGRRRVSCLIRATKTEAVATRWSRLLDEIEVDPDNARVIEGDITQTGLGLEDALMEELTRDVGHVIHCAADTNATRPYHALRKTNVAPIFTISEFCSRAGAIFHHISSLAVYASRRLRPRLAPEAGLDADHAIIEGGYAQSKAASELYLSRQSIPSVVYRLGLLLKEDGSNTPQALRQEIRMDPPLESEALLFDVTPMGWCAEVIVRLMERARPGKTYHIAGDRRISAAELHGLVGSTTRRAVTACGFVPCTLYLSGGIEFEMKNRPLYETLAGAQPNAEAVLLAHLEALK